ncbi:MAG TPA: sensor histidine kinase N-terminal domain-containing protein, partial [Methylomirabilota bacterium]|nr:sensor histidine kinase N-terminal domain-containing protein [Methylomirabilota bacterium]
MTRALSIHTRLTLWYAGALLAILVVISGLSYSLLAWSLAQDVDRSLLAVAEVVRDASHGGDHLDVAEQWLREFLDPEHQLFQLLDPEGGLLLRSRRLRGDTLPLSPAARRSVIAGEPAFDTVLLHGERLRVVTLPVRRGGRLVEVVQVGAPLRPAERTLERWAEALAVLVPLGVGLAAA